MKLFAYINLSLAIGLVLAFGLGTSLAGVVYYTSPALYAELTGAIARIPARGGMRALVTDIVGWPAWVFPLALAALAGVLTMGRSERRG